MDNMHFSWVIPDVLAGCRGPVRREDLLFLKAQGVGAILRMEEHTISGDDLGLADLAEPVPDMCPPTLEQLDRIMAFIHAQVAQGTAVAVSCRAGIGRTGTVLACYLVDQGYDAQGAVRHIRDLRPGSLETPLQVDAVSHYENKLKNPLGTDTGS